MGMYGVLSNTEKSNNFLQVFKPENIDKFDLTMKLDCKCVYLALGYTHRYSYLMQAGSMINITIFFSFQTHHVNLTRRLED